MLAGCGLVEPLLAAALGFHGSSILGRRRIRMAAHAGGGRRVFVSGGCRSFLHLRAAAHADRFVSRWRAGVEGDTGADACKDDCGEESEFRFHGGGLFSFVVMRHVRRSSSATPRRHQPL